MFIVVTYNHIMLIVRFVSDPTTRKRKKRIEIKKLDALPRMATIGIFKNALLLDSTNSRGFLTSVRGKTCFVVVVVAAVEFFVLSSLSVLTVLTVLLFLLVPRGGRHLEGRSAAVDDQGRGRGRRQIPVGAGAFKVGNRDGGTLQRNRIGGGGTNFALLVLVIMIILAAVVIVIVEIGWVRNGNDRLVHEGVVTRHGFVGHGVVFVEVVVVENVVVKVIFSVILIVVVMDAVLVLGVIATVFASRCIAVLRFQFKNILQHHRAVGHGMSRHHRTNGPARQRPVGSFLHELSRIATAAAAIGMSRQEVGGRRGHGSFGRRCHGKLLLLLLLLLLLAPDLKLIEVVDVAVDGCGHRAVVLDLDLAHGGYHFLERGHDEIKGRPLPKVLPPTGVDQFPNVPVPELSGGFF